MESTANISGSISIILSPDRARQSDIWGRAIFWKKPEKEEIELFQLTKKINELDGVSGVWYTDDKNSELFATIKVHNPDEGNKIATTISGYKGVKAVQISLGHAGPPPPPPSP
jgi:hypothetical protein